jgi:adenylate kinase family enzyme
MPLILIRGLPGSGKSTLAKKIMNDSSMYNVQFVHLEADMYFINNGVYTFDREKIHEAHRWCFRSAEILLDNGQNVIVSNTFTTLKEIQPYIDLEKNKEDLRIIHCDKNYGNIHNVPDETLQKMKDRFEKIEGEILTSDYDESEIK